MKILLVGTGNIAHDYVKVFQGLKVDFKVVGRSKEGCAKFSSETGISASPGGVEENLSILSQCTHAILAIDASQLSPVAQYLMRHNIGEILIEKPGCISRMELEKTFETKKETNSNVYIAYNRRFYASTQQAKKIIDSDDGVQSFHFEFTEWPHTVQKSGLPQKTIRNWLLCNSTHIIDLAFYLGGYPKQICCFSDGESNWTDEHIRFSGAGISENNALFDYCANWDAPGRWNIEIMTNIHRIIFRPIEKLQIQQLGSVKIEMDNSIDYTTDTIYKPGLYNEVSTFLGFQKENQNVLKTVKEQLEMFTLFEKISGREYR